MEVECTMSRQVVTCRPEDSLALAARAMRTRDCGVLPVVDCSGALVGMVTDRDLCMAALELGRPLNEIAVREAMASDVVALDPHHSLAFAAELMGELQLRRLPVVDAERHPIGILSLVDLARRADCGEMRGPGDVGMDEVSSALAGIGRPGPALPGPAACGPLRIVRPASLARGRSLAPRHERSSRRLSW